MQTGGILETCLRDAGQSDATLQTGTTWRDAGASHDAANSNHSESPNMTTENIMHALDSIEVNQREIKDRLMCVEQKSSAPADGMQTKTDSLGAQFVKAFEANKDLFQKTRSVRLEIKAAGDAVTTSSGRTIVSGGVGAPGANLLGLQNALTVRPAPGTSAVEYSRYTGQ